MKGVIGNRFCNENTDPVLYIFNLLTCKTENFENDIHSKLANYSEIIDIDQLKSELNVWYKFIDKHHSGFGCRSNVQNALSEIFIENNCREVFPMVFRLARLYLSIPVSSATPERTFSCLKRLLTWQRNAMCHERLSSLALINIEKAELENLDIEYVIDKFAEKDRKKKFI